MPMSTHKKVDNATYVHFLIMAPSACPKTSQETNYTCIWEHEVCMAKTDSTQMKCSRAAGANYSTSKKLHPSLSMYMVYQTTLCVYVSCWFKQVNISTTRVTIPSTICTDHTQHVYVCTSVVGVKR